MNCKYIAMTVTAGVLAFGAVTASAATTVIGSAGQSNTQGGSSSQSGQNGSAGGSTFILGDSAPTAVQDSTNVASNDQEIGGGIGTTTLIAPNASQCFCQGSQQGVNSSQVGANGDGGGSTLAILGDSAPTLVQTSTNVLDNGQFIGGGIGDTILIGGSAQVNKQGFNSSQSGENGSSAGGGILLIGDDSLGLLRQSSANILSNVVILGG